MSKEDGDDIVFVSWGFKYGIDDHNSWSNFFEFADSSVSVYRNIHFGRRALILTSCSCQIWLFGCFGSTVMS